MKKRMMILVKGSSVFGLLQFATINAAFAHHAMDGSTPQTLGQGLLAGLAHPVLGPDHLLFLVIAGCLASLLPGRVCYAVAAVFVAGALLGVIGHIAGVGLSFTEVAIALSVLIGGVLMCHERRWRAQTLGLVLAGSAVFHGYAYAESIVGAETAPMGAYLTGLSVIQFFIIVGLAAVLKLNGAAYLLRRGPAIRYGGAVAAAAGCVFLVRSLAL